MGKTPIREIKKATLKDSHANDHEGIGCHEKGQRPFQPIFPLSPKSSLGMTIGSTRPRNPRAKQPPSSHTRSIKAAATEDWAAVRTPYRQQDAACRLPESLRPTIIKALGDAFAPAQFRDAVLAAQAIKHNADFLLGGILFARCSANVPHKPFGRRLRAIGFLACLMKNRLPALWEPPPGHPNMPGGGGGRIGFGLVTMDRR
jgi:hypothetical protein